MPVIKSFLHIIFRDDKKQLGKALLLLFPSLFILTAFAYWPVVSVIIQSFRVADFGTTSHWGAGNYAQLFADPTFWAALRINALYALGTMIPSLFLALIFALQLRQNSWLTAILRTIFVAPMMLPLVAAAALGSFVFLPGVGLIDHFLGHLGLGAHEWLGNQSTALPCIIAISVWKDTGTYMLFFLAGLSSIPDEFIEAAELDGATAQRRFFYIILPLLMPTFAFLAPIALLNAMIQVDQVVLLTQGGPSNSTMLLLYYIYQQVAQNNNVGLASAATIISVTLLFLISKFLLKFMERRTYYAS